MNMLTHAFAPSITSLIRMDHTHVLSVFHQYRAGSRASTKQALVRAACLGLEIHAQLEEEIFYPAMQAAAPDNHVLDKNVPEHDEMRQLIAELRSMEAADPAYDRTFMELMRSVIHHVADEETMLLPEAERIMPQRLNELGTQMTRRRLELAAPYAGELAMHSFQAASAGTMKLAAGALMAGTSLIRRTFSRQV